MKIRVVFFDLDDTLYPAEAVYQLGLQAAWRKLRPSHPISWAQFLKVYTRARRDVKARLGTTPSGRNRVLYFKRVVEILTGRSQPALVLALMNAYDTCWRHIDAAPVRALARKLSQRYQLGIMTNQVAGFQLTKMLRIDPEGRWFRHIVTSEEIGCEKPAKIFFLEACRMAGCRPAEAVLVGDNWSADMVGALRAGMRGVYVHAGPLPKPLPRGVVRIRSLSELEKSLQELAGQ